MNQGSDSPSEMKGTLDSQNDPQITETERLTLQRKAMIEE